jgi:hypothetical protein
VFYDDGYYLIQAEAKKEVVVVKPEEEHKKEEIMNEINPFIQNQRYEALS